MLQLRNRYLVYSFSVDRMDSIYLLIRWIYKNTMHYIYVGKGREVTLPCSYQSTCYVLFQIIIAIRRAWIWLKTKWLGLERVNLKYGIFLELQIMPRNREMSALCVCECVCVCLRMRVCMPVILCFCLK